MSKSKNIQWITQENTLRFEKQHDLEERKMILSEIRKKSGAFKKFSDDQLLYITGPIYRSTNKNRFANLKKHSLFS